MTATPNTTERGEEALRTTLREHWLTSIGCDHEAGTNTPTCSCSLWKGPTLNSVGAAVDAWIDHALEQMPAHTGAGEGEKDGVPLSMLWRGRARALRALDRTRHRSHEATCWQAEAFDKCADELEAALRTALATSAPAGDGEAEKAADQIISEMHSLKLSEWDRQCLHAKIVAALRRAQPPQPTEHRTCATCHAVLADGPQPAACYEAQPTGDAEGLVERLRLGASKSRDVGSHLSKYQALCDEAADAIIQANSRFAALVQDHDDYRQAAQVEAGLRREFLARAEAAEARVAVLEKALKWIDEQRYTDRSTVSQDNAWEAWQRLNSSVVSIYDRARATLSTGAGEEKR